MFLRKKCGPLQLKFYSYIFSKSENDEEDQFKLYQSLTQSLQEVQKENSELEEEIERYDIYFSRHSPTTKE